MLAREWPASNCDDAAEITRLQQNVEQGSARQSGCTGEQRHF
jgi:hypothetical protein